MAVAKMGLKNMVAGHFMALAALLAQFQEAHAVTLRVASTLKRTSPLNT
jgi:hypothetical protein